MYKEIDVISPPYYCCECNARLPNEPNDGDEFVKSYTYTMIRIDGLLEIVPGATTIEYVPAQWVCSCGAEYDEQDLQYLIGD